jgi:hypothetical protein
MSNSTFSYRSQSPTIYKAVADSCPSADSVIWQVVVVTHFHLSMREKVIMGSFLGCPNPRASTAKITEYADLFTSTILAVLISIQALKYLRLCIVSVKALER